MKHSIRNTLILAAVVQVLCTARVLTFAALFRFLPAEYLDREALVASILAAIAAEAEMVA